MTDEPQEYSKEQLIEQQQLLSQGIELAQKWLDEGSNYEVFRSYSLKEQKFSRVLDPLLWIMRDANVAYEHDCEDCATRINTGGTGLGLAVADMLIREEESNGNE